jgi:ssDNA-binding Zn-finger/Zn-ribbon topoisomerase 1
MNENMLEGIKCPQCGSLGPFVMSLNILGYAVVTDDGWDDLQIVESEFHGLSSCVECNHEWNVNDLTDEELSDLLDLAESLDNEPDEDPAETWDPNEHEDNNNNEV